MPPRRTLRAGWPINHKQTHEQIPSIISDYYSASDAGDIARLVDCFSNRATVVDEGRTYEGRDEKIEHQGRPTRVVIDVPIGAETTNSCTEIGSEP